MLEIHCGDSSKHWGYTIVSISDNSGYIDSGNRYNNDKSVLFSMDLCSLFILSMCQMHLS